MKRALLTLLGLLASLSAAIAQVPPFPSSLPSRTVVGNLGPVAGPARAVSLASLQSALSGGGETTVADANYAVVAADRTIVYTSLTASRTVGLLPAAAYLPGTFIDLIDRSGSASSTVTISVSPSGTNTINGANATFRAIGAAYVGIRLESDGVSKWTAVQDPALGAASNIWNGDQYFKSGAPWVDARAYCPNHVDSTSDDSTCIQNAIDSLTGGLGGEVRFTRGVYCVNSGVTVSTAAVRLVGYGGSNTTAQISACGSDVTPVTINAFTAGVINLSILGGGLTSTHPALLLGSSCTECLVEHARAQGGTNAIKIQASDFLLSDLHVESSYGSRLIWALGAGFYDRVKADQTFPVSTPSIGAAPSAWTNAHAYTAGNIVSNTGYYIQATANCTSGSSAPTNQNYGTNITDSAGGGTCVWKLVAPTTYYSLNLDTGASINVIHATDHTGPFTAGIYLSNSLAGTAPQSTTITDSTVGQSYTAGIYAHDGNGLMVKGTQIANCLVNGCSGILLGNSFTGDATISSNLIFTNPVGINLAAGTNTTISGNLVFNSSSIGIAVQANVTKFTIADNNVGLSAVWGGNAVGIQVLAGASDFYRIVNNATTGATTEVTDGGTGTHKIVFGNGTSMQLALANGGTNASLTASNGGIFYSTASAGAILSGTATASLPLLSGATAAPTWATISYPTSATSGGVPYFSSTTVMASSAALNNNTLIAGGGAGNPPKISGLTVSGSDLTSLQASSSVSSLPQFILTNNVADANPASFLFQKNRAAANTNASDAFLDMQGYGWANSAQRVSARWQIIQTGASSGNNIPSKHIWSTSDTAGQLDNTLTFDSASHVSNTQNTAPSITAGCSGAGSGVVGTDLAGTVTGSTAAATTCTLTFGTAYASAPACTATGLSSPLTGAVTPGTTTLVVNFASTANFKWTYVCHGA